MNDLELVGSDRLFVERLITYEEDQSVKYWLWDDYKKIIELSGYIQ